MLTAILTLNACSSNDSEDDFEYSVEKFGDLEVLRYPVLGFDSLPAQQKEFIYYMSQAAIEGRDIIFDQNYKHNLTIRRTLEAIYQNYNGDRSTEDFKAFEVYLKRVWFANGIHHHYSMDKFYPEMSEEAYGQFLADVPDAALPMNTGENREIFALRTSTIIFDKTFETKRVNQTPGEDLIKTSACNYYGDGVSQEEVESFYGAMKNADDKTPPSYGLNSKLVSENGKLKEQVYKIGGMYGATLERIVYWLEKAIKIADTDQQQQTLAYLIDYYKTGDLKTFDDFSISWVSDLDSHTDFVNGFTETYGDPLGLKASWESIVNFKNDEATKRTEIVSGNAQWFEDHSPVEDRFQKDKVKGVTAKVITAAIIAGDCYPATPIGVNLPNADWIRRDHGSKSVTIENITYAYDKASAGGMLSEFAYNKDEIQRAKDYGFITHNLFVDMHECLGHGSGQLMPGVTGDELKAYGATIEEARADLFGIYYLADAKMVELGLLPDADAYKAAYDDYMRGGLMTQLTRIAPGADIEESHMRNRQLIAKWAYVHGKEDQVVEIKKKDGKTYIVVNDYEKLRALFGELLAEIQHIKSTGDYEAGKEMVEEYAVKVDQEIHKEVLARFAKLNIAAYKGFVNPKYVPIMENGKIIDIHLDYTEGYAEQMLRYSKENSRLPNYN
ncbi:MAG: dihydrofolate reductase [Bacteroidales bacterium]|nr:dihydrofolate reductase [Bacteroidales bacterium]